MRTPLILLIVLLVAQSATAQFRPSFGGSPPGGGPPGMMGGFRPEDMLRRIDQNGNGVLEPSETEGRARYFLERIARDVPGIDLNKPIPIDQLARGMQKMREQRYGGGGPSGGSSGSRSSSSGQSASKPKEPLVPGFGLVEDAPAVPGFGEDAEMFAVEVTDADLRESQDRFRRYDRNKDGQLSREEISGGRWYDDPFQYDQNRDNKLSVEELAVRYARRRIDRQGQNSSTSQASFSSRGDSGGQERRSWFGRSGGSSNNSDGSGSRKSGGRRQKDDRKSYRLSSTADRLPKGLPDWFARTDVNTDGQVMMHEFASSWSDSLVADFLQFDLNADGVITPTECLSAVKSGVIRGDSGTYVAQSDEAANRPARATPAGRGPAPPLVDSAPASSPAPAADKVEIDSRTFAYFTKVVDEADANGDGELTQDEWSQMSRDPSDADRDGNGRITALEYARWRLNK